MIVRGRIICDCKTAQIRCLTAVETGRYKRSEIVEEAVKMGWNMGRMHLCPSRKTRMAQYMGSIVKRWCA